MEADYKDPFECYSRNPVVAVPTLIGNAAGAVVGAVVGFPVMAIERAAGRKEETVGEVIVATPIFVGGAITGTAFLPLAPLLPERPWMVGPPRPSKKSLAVLASAMQRTDAAATRAEKAAADATEAAYRAEKAARRVEEIVHRADSLTRQRRRLGTEENHPAMPLHCMDASQSLLENHDRFSIRAWAELLPL